MFSNTIPTKADGEFYLAVTGFTKSDEHGIGAEEYCAAIRNALTAGIMRVLESYPKLKVLRGSKGPNLSFDSLVSGICEELGVPQLVFTVEKWKPYVVEASGTEVFIVPEEDSFSNAMAYNCDLLMAFGGGEIAAEMVGLAIFNYHKKVVLASPYSDLNLTDVSKMQSIERLISRISMTPSSREVTVEEEIGRTVDLIVAKAASLKRSKQLHGLSSKCEAIPDLPFIDDAQLEPGVFKSTDGSSVVR